jgi:DNA-directed RNA polymerase subunit L
MQHCATFQLKHEDHTLGNALRYLLMKEYASILLLRPNSLVSILSDSSSIVLLPNLASSPQVDFAGYAIPHPSKPYIHLHVQTNGMLNMMCHPSVMIRTIHLAFAVTDTGNFFWPTNLLRFL